MTARLWRQSTLVLPFLCAWVSLRTDGASHPVLEAASTALLPVWVVMAMVVLGRALERKARSGSAAEAVDVLTAAGRISMWSGAAAVVAAVALGWASLALLGVLGLVVPATMVVWTAWVGGAPVRWRRFEVSRAILPTDAIEGDPLVEEVTLRGLSIPPGLQLFVRGRAWPRGVETRQVLSSIVSGAELRLVSELGPALRGEHAAPPLEVSFGDVLGLARTPRLCFAPTTVVVRPRPVRVTQLPALIGAGGDDASRPAELMPTEGSFRMRPFVDGDDTRRIHWKRSLAQDQLIVRLPDEVPADRPATRLVLDTVLGGASELRTSAPAELLDALVGIWLGVAEALLARDVPVTVVTAVRRGGRCVVVERRLHGRSLEPALELGALATWQSEVPLSELLGAETRQLVVSALPRATVEASLTWIVVPEVAFSEPEAAVAEPSLILLPFLTGAAENRADHRRRTRVRALRARRDGALFDQRMSGIAWPRLSGSLLARRHAGRVDLERIP